MMTKAQMRKTAYERFKFWWMMSHGYTIQDLTAAFVDFAQNKEECPEMDFGTYMEDVGFPGGCVWPCFPEFLDNEYKKPEIMYCILDENEYLEYLQIEEQEKPRFFNRSIRVATENGIIEAYDKDNPDYPGVVLSFTPNNNREVDGPGCMMEEDGCGKVHLVVYTLEKRSHPMMLSTKSIKFYTKLALCLSGRRNK